MWFAILVPGGETVVVAETSGSDVTLRAVDGCDATDCLDYAENPEIIQMVGDPTSDAYQLLVISEDGDNTQNAFNVTFTIL